MCRPTRPPRGKVLYINNMETRRKNIGNHTTQSQEDHTATQKHKVQNQNTNPRSHANTRSQNSLLRVTSLTTRRQMRPMPSPYPCVRTRHKQHADTLSAWLSRASLRENDTSSTTAYRVEHGIVASSRPVRMAQSGSNRPVRSEPSWVLECAG